MANLKSKQTKWPTFVYFLAGVRGRIVYYLLAVGDLWYKDRHSLYYMSLDYISRAVYVGAHSTGYSSRLGETCQAVPDHGIVIFACACVVSAFTIGRSTGL